MERNPGSSALWFKLVHSFNHKAAGAEACNMSHWMDQAEMVSPCRFAIKKDGEAECMDDVEIAATEVLGTVCISARLVVVPISIVYLANLIFARNQKVRKICFKCLWHCIFTCLPTLVNRE